MNHQQNPILSAHFGLLKEHAELTSKGIPSEQASRLVFSNETTFMEMREASSRSSCCNADIASEGALDFCTNCGDSWVRV